MGNDKTQNMLLYRILTWASAIMVVALVTYLTSTALANRERIIKVEVAQQQYVENQKSIMDTQKSIIEKLDSLNLQISNHIAEGKRR